MIRSEKLVRELRLRGVRVFVRCRRIGVQLGDENIGHRRFRGMMVNGTVGSVFVRVSRGLICESI